MLKLFRNKYSYFSLIGGITMRFLSTLFYMILIVIGIIVSINVFAFIMGFFVIQKEQKGKIVYLYMLLLIAALFLSALFTLTFFKYEFIAKFFLILSMLFLLMLAIIVANNSLLNDSEERDTHYTKALTNNNSKNGHSIFYNTLAILGLVYLFHEVFDDDDYHYDDNYNHYNDENFHDDNNYNDDYHDYNYDNHDSDNSDGNS